MYPKQGTYMVHAIIPEKYQNYSSTTILKHANVLAKLNKMPHVRLLNITPHDPFSITIHVYAMTISGISHEQKE